MKKFLVGLAVVIFVLALGFAGFVWWKLQPWADLQPMPPMLHALDSDEGRLLLEGADAVTDYQTLADSFEPQSLVSFCGVASGVTVLNAMGRELTQYSFFNDDTGPVRSRFEVMFGGMSLTELAGLLEAHDTNVAVQHADASTLEEFRATIERNLSTEHDFLVANYQRELLGQGRVGHISPLAAYDRESDKVLILDVAEHKYPATWVPVELLFSAMSTIDPSSGKARGFVEVAETTSPAPL